MKDFLEHLRQEKLDTQKRRLEYVRLKFMLVVALFGIGTWKFNGIEDNYLLLYLIPFVGFAIDLYVHGENFAIRRIGFFVRESREHDSLERAWELFVNDNRDQFTRIGINVVSILLFLGTFFILHFKEGNIVRNQNPFLHYLWVIINLILIIVFIVINFIGYNSLNKNKIPISDNYQNKKGSKGRAILTKLLKYIRRKIKPVSQIDGSYN